MLKEICQAFVCDSDGNLIMYKYLKDNLFVLIFNVLYTKAI